MDAELVVLARAGDENAKKALWERSFRVLYAFVFSRVRRHDLAEDVTQEALSRAARQFSSFQDHGDFASWIFGITRHCLQETYRSDRRWQKNVEAARGKGWRKQASIDDRIEVTLTGLADLDDDTRTVLTLKYLEGLSCTEIAARLNRPLGTITSLLTRGLRALRERLKER